MRRRSGCTLGSSLFPFFPSSSLFIFIFISYLAPTISMRACSLGLIPDHDDDVMDEQKVSSCSFVRLVPSILPLLLSPLLSLTGSLPTPRPPRRKSRTGRRVCPRETRDDGPAHG
jgi:hypothetical protein